MAERVFVVEPHSEHIGKGCPTCRRGIEEGQTIVECPRCHTIHHEKCWFGQGGCGKLGCTGVASKKRTGASESTSESGAPATGSAAAATDVKPVSAEANQLPTGVLIGVAAVVIIIILYFLLR